MIRGISGRDDSFLIGFVRYATCSHAITLDEMKTWIYTLLKQHDDLPTYFFDILEIEHSSDFYKIIEFPVDTGMTEKEGDALFGIAWKRGNLAPDADLNISRKKALKALAESPQLEKRFRETFPFIEW